MREDRHTNPIDEILASIKSAVSEAYQAFERGDDAAWRIQGAFVRMRVLLEAAGLPEALKAVQQNKCNSCSTFTTA